MHNIKGNCLLTVSQEKSMQLRKNVHAYSPNNGILSFFKEKGTHKLTKFKTEGWGAI